MARITSPPAWVADAVFYQVFPDRFARAAHLPKPSNLEPWDAPPTVHGYKGGDLLGVAERLDYLTDLGITAIYFNPIFQSAANHRYHTHDYYRVDPMLGGDDAFAKLLAACQERDIRVIVDGVFNHASRGFFQFNDILENGPGSPWKEWFRVNGYPLRAYARDEKPNYEAWWGMPALPKFNTDHPDVREYLMRVGEHWIRRGIDGWRLDVPEEITTAGFWEEFRDRVKAINPEAYLVGEIWHDATDWIARGDRFDGAMNYPLAGAILSFVGGDRIDTSVLQYASYHIAPIDAGGYADAVDSAVFRYPEPAVRSNFNLIGSHDVPRARTVMGGDTTASILAKLLLLTLPGAPSIYYGDEIGLAGGKDPANRAAFPWDEASWDHDILRATRELVALRRGHAALRTGAYRRLSPPPGHYGTFLYVFERSLGGERFVVAANTGPRTETASVTELADVRLDPVWGDAVAVGGDDGTHLRLAPRSAVVWRVVP